MELLCVCGVPSSKCKLLLLIEAGWQAFQYFSFTWHLDCTNKVGLLCPCQGEGRGGGSPLLSSPLLSSPLSLSPLFSSPLLSSPLLSESPPLSSPLSSPLLSPLLSS